MLGKEKINDCLIIDEIIFLETMKSDKKWRFFKVKFIYNQNRDI
jgi:hypothetical protein